MLIIGSTAMYREIPDFRDPKDLDVFARPDDPSLELHKPKDVFWHPALAHTQLDRTDFASMNEMYTIKVSHSYWELKNGSWDKHMADIVALKKNGATLDLELHKILYRIWEDTHGKKKMNLAQAAGDFFDDAVTRIYDHDSIHRSVAYDERPIYELILKDGETVDIDPD